VPDELIIKLVLEEVGQPQTLKPFPRRPWIIPERFSI
jgi:hypothetical protein